jgi:hypothetical protein
MITESFQLRLIVFLVTAIISLLAYGWYCRRRSNSYVGTGRVAEIETWTIKAAISWLAGIALTLATATIIF